MDVEDLAALAEPADHLEDLGGRVVEHLGDRALAEIEPVTGALVHLHKALHSLDRAKDASDGAIAGRRVGVVRVAGEPHLGRGRDRNDLAEEMVDPLSVLVLGEDAGRGRGCGLVGAAPAEGGVARAAAPGLARGARDADDAEIVFGGGDAGRRQPLDQPADAVDLVLPLGVLAQQDVRALGRLDRPRRQRQLHHVERETERLDMLLAAPQLPYREQGAESRLRLGAKKMLCPARHRRDRGISRRPPFQLSAKLASQLRMRRSAGATAADEMIE
jgi:hypothetical protein